MSLAFLIRIEAVAPLFNDLRPFLELAPVSIAQ